MLNTLGPQAHACTGISASKSTQSEQSRTTSFPLLSSGCPVTSKERDTCHDHLSNAPSKAAIFCTSSFARVRATRRSRASLRMTCTCISKLLMVGPCLWHNQGTMYPPLLLTACPSSAPLPWEMPEWQLAACKHTSASSGYQTHLTDMCRPSCHALSNRHRLRQPCLHDIVSGNIPEAEVSAAVLCGNVHRNH